MVADDSLCHIVRTHRLNERLLTVAVPYKICTSIQNWLLLDCRSYRSPPGWTISLVLFSNSEGTMTRTKRLTLT
jgi:hypothetical protein